MSENQSRPSRSLYLASLLALALAGASPGAAQPTDLEKLSWLAGHWSSTDGGKTTEEIWMAPAGGVMLGINRESSTGSSRSFFEYLRIEKGSERLQYVASPLGQGTTVFAASEITERRAVFENPEHDWPQRIAYELLADGSLHVEASALDPSGRRIEWTHRRVVPHR